MVKRFNWLVFCLLFSVGMMAKSGGRQYNSYKGLVMAGYQGWFNAPGDGSGRGWHHYNGSNGFRPGSCSVDFWPEVSEYKKLYKTEFTFADGKPASVFSSYDESTVDLHFKWMKQYGLDGVFMQRFVAEIRNESGLKHFNKVLNSAMKSANKYERAICVMYDLSGMQLGEEKLLLKDIDEIAKRYSLKDHAKNPSYLYHNGKPLVTVWGVGFNDNRRFDIGFMQQLMEYGGQMKEFAKLMRGETDFYGHFQPLYIDTIVLGQLALSHLDGMTSYKLEIMAEKFGIELDDAHDADADVTATTNVAMVCSQRMRNASGIDDGSMVMTKTEKSRVHFKI